MRHPESQHARAGYCGATVGPATLGSECAAADRQGTFLGAVDLDACRRQCESCDACRFVSYSATKRDCTWFDECDLTRLYTSVYDGASYTTVQVRPSPRRRRQCDRPRGAAREWAGVAPGAHAFATFVCNSTGRGANRLMYGARDEISPWDNVLQAVQLGRSLAGSRIDRVAFTRGVSASAASELRDVGWRVVDLSHVPTAAFGLRAIREPDGSHHWPRSGRVQQRRDTECTSFKLLAFNMTMYDRLMVSDHAQKSPRSPPPPDNAPVHLAGE